MCVCVCVRVLPGPVFSWMKCGAGVCAWAWVAPPLLAGMLGRVCVGVRAPLVPRPSWLGCAVWARVPGLRFWPCPPTPGWGVGVCVCTCVCQFLAGWCVCVGLGFVRSLVFSWLECSGAWPLVCAASVSRHLLGVPPVDWGCAGVAVLGVCPSPSPFVFFSGWGGCHFWPCRVVALWCLLLAVPVLGLVVSVPPPPLVPAPPSCFFSPVSAPARCVLACAGCPFFQWAAALGCVLLVLAGWSSGVPSGGPVGAVPGAIGLGGLPASCGRVGGFVAVGLSRAPPPFFGGRGLPVPPSAFPWLVHALVGIRCG